MAKMTRKSTKKAAPAKKTAKKDEMSGLTPAQKKLPPALRAAIMKRKKKNGKK